MEWFLLWLMLRMANVTLTNVTHGQIFSDASLFWCWYDCSIEILMRSLLLLKEDYKILAMVWKPISKIWWTDFRWVAINVSCKNIFNNNMHWEKGTSDPVYGLWRTHTSQKHTSKKSQLHFATCSTNSYLDNSNNVGPHDKSTQTMA